MVAHVPRVKQFCQVPFHQEVVVKADEARSLGHRTRGSPSLCSCGMSTGLQDG